MPEHAIKKPTLFISHATSDAEFANAVKQEIEKVFANGVYNGPRKLDQGISKLWEREGLKWEE